MQRGKNRQDPVRHEDSALFNEQSKASVLEKGANNRRTQKASRMASQNASARKPVVKGQIRQTDFTRRNKKMTSMVSDWEIDSELSDLTEMSRVTGKP